MKKLTSAALLTLMLACGISALAQSPAATPAAPATPKAASTGGKSAHETTSRKIDGNRVILVYGRPNSKSPKTGEIRKIWGDLVPFGKIWRTGSDEATLLITQQPIVLGGSLEVPAGAFTLFTLPAADGSAKLIVNKQIGQWGIDPYDEKQELGRVDLEKITSAERVDQFTMSVDKGPITGGRITMAWENTIYSVPFAVKKP